MKSELMAAAITIVVCSISSGSFADTVWYPLAEPDRTPLNFTLEDNVTAVYINPVNTGAVDAGAFSQINQQLAGEFVLGTSANIDGASWFGTLFGGTVSDGTTWAFKLNFYTNLGNLPDTLIASRSVSATLQSAGTLAFEPAYSFTVTFSDVSLLGGTNYWFSAVNVGTQDTFRWTEATSGLGSAFNQGSVPEPSTWAMMILGFAGIGFMAYRRSQSQH